MSFEPRTMERFVRPDMIQEVKREGVAENGSNFFRNKLKRYNLENVRRNEQKQPNRRDTYYLNTRSTIEYHRALVEKYIELSVPSRFDTLNQFYEVVNALAQEVERNPIPRMIQAYNDVENAYLHIFTKPEKKNASIIILHVLKYVHPNEREVSDMSRNFVDGVRHDRQVPTNWFDDMGNRYSVNRFLETKHIDRNPQRELFSFMVHPKTILNEDRDQALYIYEVFVENVVFSYQLREFVTFVMNHTFQYEKDVVMFTYYVMMGLHKAFTKDRKTIEFIMNMVESRESMSLMKKFFLKTILKQLHYIDYLCTTPLD